MKTRRRALIRDSKLLGVRDVDWRYDRVTPEQEWAACVWEYGRLWHNSSARVGRLQARMATIEVLCRIPEFPGASWLRLGLAAQRRLSLIWRFSPGELEDYRVLEIQPLASAGQNTIMEGHPSASDWRRALRKLGVVVFDLGRPPIEMAAEKRERLPSRAELLSRFEAWLDANPEWWKGRGDGRRVSRIGGKELPRDGLRALAWLKIREAAGSDKAACAYLADVFSRDSSLRQWFSISLDPRATVTRSRLARMAKKWQRRVCEPN